jgi:hypothetical protein
MSRLPARVRPALAWCLATGAAVALTWYGAADVGRGPFGEGHGTPVVPAPGGEVSSTHRPRPAGDAPEERTVTTAGGRVALALRPGSAGLRSAEPAGGWTARPESAPGLLRITFTRDGRSVVVEARWDADTPPAVTVRDTG